MIYRCETCGHESPKWMGFCPQCKSEGALVETARPKGPSRSVRSAPVALSAADGRAAVHRPIGVGEVDRVLGGGLVGGAAILLGGEPGVGKSTLILQIAGAIAEQSGTVLIASAEESVGQVGLRASRLGITSDSILLSSDRDVDAIIEEARSATLDLLVVDSIQTVAVRELGGAAGGVAQVRESSARLIHYSKESGVPVVLVGHVTKDGAIAGPKLVEHAVDVVLYLEGDLQRGLRVLRGLKNRFGATHQVGLFEMMEKGLVEVTDPAGLLDSRQSGEVPGAVVFPAVSGRRPLLVEVQALVASTAAPQPRRSVQGLEVGRVHQVVAVLERHAGLSFTGKDVYVSVVGGIKLQDPGADLAIAIALASSLLGRPTGPLAAWGEVGLTGEIRQVAQGRHREAAARRLGIERIIGPGSGDVHRLEETLAAVGLLDHHSREPASAAATPRSGR